MQKFITDIKSLATLLMAGAAFAACSSEDNMIGGQPASQQTYTMTIEASKGGGSDAATRALSIDGNGALNATWETSNEVKAYNYTKSSALNGSLKPQSSGVSATLTGSLTGSVAVDDIIFLCWPSVDADYTGQDGKLETIAQRYDYTKGVAKVTSVDGTTIGAEDSSHGGPVLFTNNQAIVKFTLTDKANDAPIRATQLTIDAKVDGESRLIQSITYPDAYKIGPITINRTKPTDNVVYAALPFSSQANFTFSLTATDGIHNYTYEKAGVTMLNGRYYDVKVKMKRATYPITLSEVTSGYLGSVVTTDGTVYATKADAIAAEKTAAGMIAYVSGIGQGLAIALADETSAMNWSTAITTAAAHTPAVTGGTWRLPSKEDWENMFSANDNNERSYTGLNTAITNAGGVALKDGNTWYWSITEYNDSKACYVNLYDNAATFEGFIKVGDQSNLSVRACLAFGPARGHALASSAVGEIVGSDGLAYYTSDKNDLPSGVTAVGMVACKNNGSNGLVIALADETGIMDWSTAITTAAAHTPKVTGLSWKLPSQDEWNQMFSANGGNSKHFEGLNTAITNAGGTALRVNNVYWSSTAANDKDGYAVELEYGVGYVYGIADIGPDDKTNKHPVRACLAF